MVQGSGERVLIFVKLGAAHKRHSASAPFS
jgi:hypothetical protein